MSLRIRRGGVDLTPPPGQVTQIPVGSLTQATLTNAGPDVTFQLASGVHRISSTLNFLAGQRMIAAQSRQAIVSGAALYTSGSFTSSGGLWFLPGQTQAGTRYVHPNGSGNELGYPEQVFYDDVPLRQVANKTDLSTGEFWFDYSANEIWVFDNPSGHKVEVGAGVASSFGGPSGIYIEGIVVEKFNTPAGGATALHLGTAWRVADCEIRWNYGAGTWSGDDSIIEHSRIHHNRYCGVFGQGNDSTLDTVEVDTNAWGGFNTNWESSASKFVKTTNLTLTDCNFHDNRGAGFWTDINNIDTTITGGTYSRNGRVDVLYGVSAGANGGFGVVAEIGYDITVTGATIEDNRGPGALASTNRGMEVSGCTIRRNGTPTGADMGGGNAFAWSTNRGSSGATSSSPTEAERLIASRYGTNAGWETRDFYAHDNTIALAIPTTGRVCGLESIPTDANDAASRTSTFNNRWLNNDYEFSSTLARYEWADVLLTGVQWRSGASTWTPFDAGGSWSPS